MSWSQTSIQDRNATLTLHWLNGISTAGIAVLMGTTKNAVVGLAHRLDLPGRPSPIQRGAAPKPPKIRRAPAVTLPCLVATATKLIETSVGQAVLHAQQGHAGADAVICRAKPEANAASGPARPPGGPAVPPDPALRDPCCWPLWPHSQRPPADPPFCRAARYDLGSPYCDEHTARAWKTRLHAA